jgi:hypothetical protein
MGHDDLILPLGVQEVFIGLGGLQAHLFQAVHVVSHDQRIHGGSGEGGLVGIGIRGKKKFGVGRLIGCDQAFLFGFIQEFGPNGMPDICLGASLLPLYPGMDFPRGNVNRFELDAPLFETSPRTSA